MENAIEEPVVFEAERWDFPGFFTGPSADLVVPIGLAGLYEIGAELFIAGTTPGLFGARLVITRGLMQIEIASDSDDTSGGGNIVRLHLYSQYQLLDGDIVQVLVTNLSGTFATISPEPGARSELFMIRVSDSLP